MLIAAPMKYALPEKTLQDFDVN